MRVNPPSPGDPAAQDGDGRPAELPGIVHRFVHRGRRILFDANACSTVEVDRLAWAVLDAMERGEPEFETVRRCFGERAVKDVRDHLDRLRERGLMFSETTPRMPPRTGETTHLVLMSTYACNLRCEYCYSRYEPYGEKSTRMSAETARAAIDFLVRESGSSERLFVAFFGGEPLLNMPVLEETVAYALEVGERHGKQFDFSVTTNAVLLTESVRKFLVDHQVYIVASVDGPPELQDAQRPAAGGHGSHDPAMTNVLEFLEARGPFGVFMRSTFTRDTIRRVPEVMEYLVGLGFRDLALEPAVLPAGDPGEIRPEDLDLVRETYAKAADRYLRELLSGNLFLFQQFTFPMRRVHGREHSFAQCGAGHGTVAVAPTGEVYPCVKLMEETGFELAGVRNGGLDPDLKKRFQSLHVFNKPRCEECWAKFICGGGCHAHAWKYGEGLHDAYPQECEFLKCCFELGMWLYAELSRHAPDVLEAVLDLEAGRRSTVRMDRGYPQDREC